MNLDSLGTHLLLQGDVNDGTNSDMPKLYLYEADASDHADHDAYALLLPSLSGLAVNDHLQGYHKGRLQLVTSARDVDEGRILAESLSKQLTLRGKDFDDMYVYHCLPQHKPIFYRRNEQGLLEHSVTFDITMRLK